MDLLSTLYKERQFLSDRIHIIGLYLKKKSDVISKTPYTDDDLQKANARYDEVQVCIDALLRHRKTKKQSLTLKHS